MEDRTMILGRSPDGTPRAVATDANGNLTTVAAAVAVQATRLVDVAGDSCMDEANNAARVNVVAGAAGGGPATIADGADVAQGSLGDAEVAGVGPASVIAILKRLRTLLSGGLPAALGAGGGLQVDGSGVALPVSGTFWQATQPVSGTFWQATQPVSGTFWQATQPVSGTFWQATQPVSVADGSDVAQGATADAAVVTDAAGTLSGKLRGLVKWAFERMPASLGQKTKAASLPVTLASDEDALGVTGTFWQATQPVSGTFWQATQPTSDTGPGWTTVFGIAGVRFTSADQSAAAADVTSAPTGGQKLVITDIIVSVDTAMRVDFSEETSGTIVATLYMAANQSGQFTPRSELKLATADKKLQVRTSVAGNISVTAFYYSEA